MEILIKATQLILSLSIIVVLHEMGHMLPAKWFKTRVEKFYLFFDWKFSLFKKKIGETEYGIGWLPLGGYVKIAGMIDESMDKDQLEKPAEPWEFRSKPAWQRLIIMTGGVIVNLLLGFFIYAMVLFVWGEEYLPNDKAVYGVHLSDESLKEFGLLEGDVILSADGVQSQTFGDVNKMVVVDGARELQVLRNTNEISVILPDNIVDVILGKNLKGIVSAPRFPNIVKSLIDTMPAAKAGLLAGDSIVEINNASFPYVFDFQKEIANHKGTEVLLGVYREGEKLSLPITITNEGKLGYFQTPPDELLSYKTQQYGLFESIPAGISKGTTTLTSYVKSMSLLFTKEGAKQIGGFGAIAGMFPAQWNWKSFWVMTALLSIILAFMNILPIPALDGGHVVFLIYEMISGKPPSENFLTRAQVIGMVLLLTLLVYANGMDIKRAIIGG